MTGVDPPRPGDVVPDARLRESGKNAGEADGMDRRALFRVGLTAAMAVGSVALGLGLRARDGQRRATQKEDPEKKFHGERAGRINLFVTGTGARFGTRRGHDGRVLEERVGRRAL